MAAPIKNNASVSLTDLIGQVEDKLTNFRDVIRQLCPQTEGADTLSNTETPEL